MSKEDAAARDDARCWAFEELSGALGEATPIGVARDATSQATIGKVGEVVSRGLFSTPLVRLHGSGLRTGHRSEVGENLLAPARTWCSLSSEKAQELGMLL